MQENIRDAGSMPGREDPQEEAIATHSSTLVWRIPWTQEPTLSSVRVGHD